MAARRKAKPSKRKMPPRRRSWAAAKNNRLTADWRASQNPIDQDISSDLRVLRARSRDLAANNPHGRRFVRLIQMNVAGPHGFQMQCRVETDTGRPLESANDMVESAWREWCAAGTCEITGRHTFRALQHILLGHVARDGEFLVREIINPQLPFGYALQVLPPDLLDEQYNEKLANGNTVVMGVEMDRFRRPIAYHLKPELAAFNEPVTRANRERVPADQIIHGFVNDSSFQTRGVPWMAAAILKIRMLGEYEIAALTKARTGATNLGFLAPSIEFAQGGVQAGEDDGSGNTIVNIEPMSVTQLDPGTTFTPWQSEYPTQQYDPFVKANLRSIASALDVSYTSLSGDLSDTSYSSARVGLLDERESYRDRQEWFVDVFLRRVFRNWLEMAWLSNHITIPASKLEKYANAKFIGRRWAWVDPQKDVDAAITEIENNLATKSEYLSEQGRDFMEVLKQRQMEQEAEAAMLKPATQPEADDDDDDDDESAPDEMAAGRTIAIINTNGNGHE